MTTVVLAEDNALLREGLVRLLVTASDVEVVGSASDLPSALLTIARWNPDVVVTDIRMPPTSTDEGIALAARLREERPEVGVVVLSQHDEPSYALRLLEGGSERRAYLLKDRVAGADDLVAAVRTVAAGGSVIDPKVVERLVVRGRAGSDTLAGLTPREREVLGEMAQGKSNAAIAASLVLTERAIEKHSNAIFSKLGLSEERDVNRRVRAVLMHLEAAGSA